MKFKLYYCPICEKRIEQLKPTLFVCEDCKQFIELSKAVYDSKERKVVLEFLFTEVEESGRREPKVHAMPGRNKTKDVKRS